MCEKELKRKYCKRIYKKYCKLFDIGNKGFLSKDEEEIYNIITNKCIFNKNDILGMEISEDNLNHLVNKFNLKFNRKEVKEMIEYINND